MFELKQKVFSENPQTSDMLETSLVQLVQQFVNAETNIYCKSLKGFLQVPLL